MPDADQRDLAEALFEPKQSREEIKDAKPIASKELAPVAQPSQLDDIQGNPSRLIFAE